MKVVAEGVETHQEEDMLRRQGCDEIQGYLYSRPLSPRDLAQWLRQPQPVSLRTDASGEVVLVR
jgi:EAL domain-containing protein (putative c-di-GMP-specific phosphodiesterase class I)